MMHFFKLLVLAASTTASVVSIRQAPASLPGDIQFSTSGSGCASSSNSVSRSGSYGSSQVFTIKGFATNSTANCEIHLTSSGGSAGWQVSISEITLTGTASVNSGGHINLITQVFWSAGAGNTQTLESTVTQSGSVSVTQNAAGSAVWSQCIGASGSQDILNADVRVAVTSGGGTFALSSESWQFSWRTC